MRSMILSTTARFLLPLLLLFSFFVLLRGHNEPGGGFVGGLIAAASFTLVTVADGVKQARETLRIEPRILSTVGLLTALASGCLALIYNQPFMKGLWMKYEVPVIGKLGTPLLFDIGVYLVVLGIVLQIIFSLAEE